MSDLQDVLNFKQVFTDFGLKRELIVKGCVFLMIEGRMEGCIRTKGEFLVSPLLSIDLINLKEEIVRPLFIFVSRCDGIVHCFNYYPTNNKITACPSATQTLFWQLSRVGTGYNIVIMTGGIKLTSDFGNYNNFNKTKHGECDPYDLCRWAYLHASFFEIRIKRQTLHK